MSTQNEPRHEYVGSHELCHRCYRTRNHIAHAAGRTCRYLVTIRDVGNITDDPANIHTILTSSDHIVPRERVTVSLIETLSDPVT